MSPLTQVTGEVRGEEKTEREREVFERIALIPIETRREDLRPFVS